MQLAQLVDEQVAAYNAKLRVFRTFCAHFNEAAKEFTTGPERDFAKHFSSSFLEFWKQTLANSNWQRPPVPAPPREDLRVFVRPDADAPARNHIGYAIRAHVESKTGLELNKIPQVVQVNTGWAIRAVDKTTRDLLLERQAEWADDLGASAVEASQKWHTYAVNNCPRRLTDLYGNEIDYDTAVRDEIKHQTGLTPTGRLADRGDDIAAWAAESGLGLLNTADVPTNTYGNTIDLAFSNIDLASAVVEDHLATSSDHFTLSLTILNITLALTGTLEYWAVRRISPMEFNEEVQAARGVFQNVVRRAKRQYWRNLIDGFSDSAAVYKAARWLKSPGAFQPPPLQIDGVMYETQMDKANTLRRSTLERRTEQTTSTTRGSQFVRRVKYHLLRGSLSRRQKMVPPRLATPRQGQTTSPSRYCEQFGTSLENMSGGYTKVA
ncbi:hypothetical protein H633G_10214 [Metarhizium anisopliae BRIP 53284]|nr:hypothetical protein H633G_10214 [Metarhizium anisopliae BRIP 53284]